MNPYFNPGRPPQRPPDRSRGARHVFRAVLMWLGLLGTLLLIVVSVIVARSLVADARSDGEGILIPLVLAAVRLAILVAFALALVAKIRKHSIRRK